MAAFMCRHAWPPSLKTLKSMDSLRELGPRPRFELIHDSRRQGGRLENDRQGGRLEILDRIIGGGEFAVCVVWELCLLSLGGSSTESCLKLAAVMTVELAQVLETIPS